MLSDIKEEVLDALLNVASKGYVFTSYLHVVQYLTAIAFTFTTTATMKLCLGGQLLTVTLTRTFAYSDIMLNAPIPGPI